MYFTFIIYIGETEITDNAYVACSTGCPPARDASKKAYTERDQEILSNLQFNLKKTSRAVQHK